MMPRFRIVVADTQTTLVAKVITAADLEQAKVMASNEDWTAGQNGWDLWDEPEGQCEIRDDQCREELRRQRHD